jgi:DNA mismatch repair ATPase MutL
MSGNVEKLSNTVINSLRASAVFPSFNRVVEELALNSLDAGSVNIRIIINLSTFSIEVQDDG